MTTSQDHVNGFGKKLEYIYNKMHSIKCIMRNLKNLSNDFQNGSYKIFVLGSALIITQKWLYLKTV